MSNKLQPLEDFENMQLSLTYSEIIENDKETIENVFKKIVNVLKECGLSYHGESMLEIATTPEYDNVYLDVVEPEKNKNEYKAFYCSFSGETQVKYQIQFDGDFKNVVLHFTLDIPSSDIGNVIKLLSDKNFSSEEWDIYGLKDDKFDNILLSSSWKDNGNILEKYKKFNEEVHKSIDFIKNAKLKEENFVKEMESKIDGKMKEDSYLCLITPV